MRRDHCESRRRKGTPPPHKKSSCKPAHCFWHLWSPSHYWVNGVDYVSMRGACWSGSRQFALLTAMMISAKLICVLFTQTSRSIYEAQTSLGRDLKEKEKGECDPSVGRFNCSIRGWFYRRSPSPNTSDNPSVHIFAFVQGKLKTWYTVRTRWKTKLKKKERKHCIGWAIKPEQLNQFPVICTGSSQSRKCQPASCSREQQLLSQHTKHKMKMSLDEMAFFLFLHQQECTCVSLFILLFTNSISSLLPGERCTWLIQRHLYNADADNRKGNLY